MGQFLLILRTSKEIFLQRRLVFFCSVVFLLFFEVLRVLYRDGMGIFHSQKEALTLEVFSAADLKPDTYKLLEEELKALAGVREIVSVSPEDSLERLLAEPELGIDSQWLEQKKRQMDKSAILPWSFTLYLNRWDEPFLRDLIEQISNLEVGFPRKKAVMELHYDKERYALMVALHHYLKWVRAVLMTGILFLFVFLLAVFFKGVQVYRQQPRKILMILRNHSQPKLLIALLMIGIASGFTAHLISMLILSISFFSEYFYWQKFSGTFLLSQIFFSLLIVGGAHMHLRFNENGE